MLLPITPTKQEREEGKVLKKVFYLLRIEYHT